MFVKQIWFLVLLVGVVACNTPKALNSYDLSPALSLTRSVPNKAQAILTNEGLTVYVSLAKENLPELELAAFVNAYKVGWQIASDYQSKPVMYADTINFSIIRKEFRPKTILFQFKIADVPLQSGVISVMLKNNSGEDWNPIIAEFSKSDLPIYIFEKSGKWPLFQSFFSTTDTVVLIKPGNFADGNNLEIKHLPLNNEVALPPMITNATSAETTPIIPLDLEEPLNFNKPIVISKSGHYCTNSNYLFTVFESPFLRLTTAKQLVEPLIYITTKKEREQLQADTNYKNMIDNFWLSMAGSADYARRLIGSYYGFVEKANALFTDEKPGWMTDMGMIYIIMGVPDRVSVTNGNITWYYRSNKYFDENIFFSFVKVEGNCTQGSWVLQRNAALSSPWYAFTDQWRKGVLTR